MLVDIPVRDGGGLNPDMKTLMPDSRPEDVMALFGQGRLIRLDQQHVELRGGTKEDEIEAQNWISMFIPDMVLVNKRQGR